MVLQDGQPVSSIAKKLKLTSAAIHYHINQIRAALPSIVANIEVPGFCSKSSDPEEHLWPFSGGLHTGLATPLPTRFQSGYLPPQTASDLVGSP